MTGVFTILLLLLAICGAVATLEDSGNRQLRGVQHYEDCRRGLQRCGRDCVDLATSESNCECGVPCSLLARAALPHTSLIAPCVHVGDHPILKSLDARIQGGEGAYPRITHPSSAYSALSCHLLTCRLACLRRCAECP